MIYLDHAAATPVTDKALSAMLPYFSDNFFNPSAPYLPAKHVREAYESAKDAIAHTIGAKGTDLVITAGATESINLAFTVCHVTSQSSCRVLTLPTEHAAVLEPAKQFNIDFAKVDSAGAINLVDFRTKLTPDTVLVSVSLANNELGTIQPLSEIAEIIRTERQNRLANGNPTPLYLHSDASQAASLIDINVSRLGVDLLTLNAAKCGGPKGVGALYVAHGVKVRPLSIGGGQERGLRSGTENVAGVIGFATAISEAKKHLSAHRRQYQEMASVLHQELAHDSIVAQINHIVKHNPNQKTAIQVPEPIFLGNQKHQLANFIPVCFPGIDAERIIYKLEQHEIYLSTGAACAANKGSKSHVLAAIGLTDTQIAGSLRISLGSTNTLDQIKIAADLIAREVAHEYLRTSGAGVEQENLHD